MPNYLASIFIVGVPESVAAVMICLALIEERLAWHKTIVVAMAVLLAGYGFRLLRLAFGVHTILYAMVMGYLVLRMTSAPAQKVFTAAVITVILITVSDITSVVLMKGILGATLQELQANAWLWSLSGLPHVLLLFLVVYAFHRFPPSKLRKVWQS